MVQMEVFIYITYIFLLILMINNTLERQKKQRKIIIIQCFYFIRCILIRQLVNNLEIIFN